MFRKEFRRAAVSVWLGVFSVLTKSSVSKEVGRYKERVNEDNAESTRVLLLTSDSGLTISFCYSL